MVGEVPEHHLLGTGRLSPPAVKLAQFLHDKNKDQVLPGRRVGTRLQPCALDLLHERIAKHLIAVVLRSQLDNYVVSPLLAIGDHAEDGALPRTSVAQYDPLVTASKTLKGVRLNEVGAKALIALGGWRTKR